MFVGKKKIPQFQKRNTKCKWITTVLIPMWYNPNVLALIQVNPKLWIYHVMLLYFNTSEDSMSGYGFFLATWNTPEITFGLKVWHPLPFFTEWYSCKMICHTRRRMHFVREDLFDVAKSPPLLKVLPVLLQLNVLLDFEL